MLLPNDTDYLARKERYKDLVREVERARLVRAAQARQQHSQETHRRLVGWVGNQMVKLGSKFQHYSDASPSNHKRSSLAS